MSEPTVVTVAVSDTSTKVLKLAAPFDDGPTGWTEVSFDDSGWENATVVHHSNAAPIGGASFIWHQTIESDSTCLFRTVFNAPAFSAALLYYNVDDFLTLYINGANVPGVAQENWTVIDEEDVFPFVQNGQNVIAARARNIHSSGQNPAMWQFRLDLVPVDTFVWSKVNGEWKQTTPYVKVDGSWRPVTAGWIKEGGVWKSIIS